MNDPDRRHALKRFAEYYSQASFPVPFIEKREFGIGNIKKIDARHLSFTGEADFRAYLVTNTPMFVSHSISYYDFPAATPIEKKVRQGADLVFDLDIHAEGKYAVYGLMGQVKEDAERLISDFLVGDFGMRKDHITVAFSGNRGYHIHVRDTDYLSLGGDERKEIVDYVMGNGLDFRNFFSLEEVQTGPRSVQMRVKSGPEPGEAGYRGRFLLTVLSLDEKGRRALHRGFGKEEAWKRFTGGIRAGNWNSHPFKTPEELLARLAPFASGLSLRSVNTDAGVTQDLSKLIRVENSIHGETGLIAKVVSDLQKFEPLRDASLPLKGSLKIRFIEDVPQLALLGETLGPFKKDEMKELPEAAALFYMLKGSATILW